jgi:DNA-binding NarL/FixJ family response regulator
MQGVRVLVADNHEIARLGVRSILNCQSGYELCGEAGDGSQLLEAVETLKPDVVITELVMRGRNILSVLRELFSRAPNQRVLALTYCESERLAEEALRIGVRGILLKSDVGELRAAVTAITNGGVYFTRRMTKMLLNGFLRREGSPAVDVRYSRILTTRENEIVEAIAQGMSNRKMSDMFGVAVKTIESHRSSIMRKLDLHSIPELVIYAVRNNIASTRVESMTAPDQAHVKVDHQIIEAIEPEDCPGRADTLVATSAA